MTPRIAIAGAGLAGLTCARVLQRHDIDVTVLERETSRDARRQGGTLDLHADSGQVALRTAGLFDEWRALARPEGQEQRTLDHATAELLEHEPAEGDFHPEIDRGQLRDLLLDSLAEGTVRWGKGVEAAEPGRLHLSDGTSEEFDLIIGAEGAWSRVRQAVSGALPEYTGVLFVETSVPDNDLAGHGTMVARHAGTALFAQRNSDHVRTYVGLRVPQDWRTDHEGLLTLLDGWHPGLVALIGDELIHRPIFALPVPHTWEQTPGITLLGDAAHLMPPLGVGANLAMVDGAELATAIAAHGATSEAVLTYESVMLPRSVEIAGLVAEGLNHLMPVEDCLLPH